MLGIASSQTELGGAVSAASLGFLLGRDKHSDENSYQFVGLHSKVNASDVFKVGPFCTQNFSFSALLYTPCCFDNPPKPHEVTFLASVNGAAGTVPAVFDSACE